MLSTPIQIPIDDDDNILQEGTIGAAQKVRCQLQVAYSVFLQISNQLWIQNMPIERKKIKKRVHVH